jgi:hypothetical protein
VMDIIPVQGIKRSRGCFEVRTKTGSERGLESWSSESSQQALAHKE